MASTTKCTVKHSSAQLNHAKNTQRNLLIHSYDPNTGTVGSALFTPFLRPLSVSPKIGALPLAEGSGDKLNSLLSRPAFIKATTSLLPGNGIALGRLGPSKRKAKGFLLLSAAKRLGLRRTGTNK